MSENIKVFVRARPFLPGEPANSCVTVTENQISVGEIGKTFAFDHVFDTTSTSNDIFAHVGLSAANAFLGGFNSSTIAYGQTGSGKTFTMTALTHEVVDEVFARLAEEGRMASSGGGAEVAGSSGSGSGVEQASNESAPAVAGRKFTMRVSALEVYNENIGDLFGKAGAESPASPMARDRRMSVSSALFQATTAVLNIREDPKGGVYVPGLTEMPVKSAAELLGYIESATENRRTASTLMNATSSRSHCVVTLTLQNKGAVSKCCFVDLAGSERLKKSLGIGSSGSEALANSINQMNGNKHGDGKDMVQERMKEGISINGGLLALGNVIVALCEKKPYVPYRSSKLTRLLQPMLGGNSKTTIIACVSPVSLSLEETLNTLKYADRAKSIKTNPSLVVSTFASQEEAEETIKMLREELAAARQQLAAVSKPAAQGAGVGVGLPPPWAPGPSEELRREVADLRLQLERERKLTRQLEDDLFKAEYTAMVEVERRKKIEETMRFDGSMREYGSDDRSSSVETATSSESPRPRTSNELKQLEEEREDLEALRAKKISEAERLKEKLRAGGDGDSDDEGAIAELSDDIEGKTRAIEQLERQNEEARKRVSEYAAQLGSISADKLKLESDLAKALQMLEESEAERQQKDAERAKLNREFREHVRRAEESAAEFRKRVKEAEHEIKARQGNIEKARQLQEQVERLREDLMRQRQANREEQKKSRRMSLTHMQETSGLQRKLRDSELQVDKLHALLARKEHEITKAKNQISYMASSNGPGASSSASATTRRTARESAREAAQAQIDRELQTLNEVEKEIRELKAYRSRLVTARDADGPRWERAMMGFNKRLQQIEEQCADENTGAETLRALEAEKEGITEKVKRLEPIQQKLTELDSQIDNFQSRIETLNDVRKYHLQAIRKLQKSTVQPASPDSDPLPSVRDIQPSRGRRRRRKSSSMPAGETPSVDPS